MTSAVGTGTLRPRVGEFLRRYLIVVILFGLIALLSALTDGMFLQTQNLINVVRQTSVIALLGIGLTIVIISTGIDLSVGSVLALSAVVSTSLAQQPDATNLMYPGLDVPVIVAVLAGLGIGALCGFINGSLIAVFRIAPFIATLGMFTAARGAALIYSDGRPISKLDPSFNWIGQGDILGIPVPIFLLIVVAVAAHIMLTRTRFGRYVYAIGGNEQAARVSGIAISRVKIGIYTISGLLAGLGGLILAGRIGSGNPTPGHRHRARCDHGRGHRGRELRRRHRHRVGSGRRGPDHRLAQYGPRHHERVAIRPAGRQGRDHRRRDHHRRAQEPLI